MDRFKYGASKYHCCKKAAGSHSTPTDALIQTLVTAFPASGSVAGLSTTVTITNLDLGASSPANA
jgi:hypothetical protein